MILRPDGTALYSPSDLTRFLEGDYSAWMERLHAACLADTARARPAFLEPDGDDPEQALVKAKGEQHESRVFEELRARLGDAVEIARADDAGARTLAAMRAGRRLIYQGRLDAGNWHGYPDFLLREERPSALGPWAYRPVDSKLARSAKPYFLIQLCAYADLLEHAQGLRPGALGFVLGTREPVAFETERYFYFYRHLKETFARFQAGFDPSAMPDPALERSFGRWSESARRTLEERDDLSLVARLTRGQAKRLRAAGVGTSAQLAASTGPVPRVSTEVLERLRRQARLQLASRGAPAPAFETLPHAPFLRAGLAALPPASAGDVFFDLEGYPLAEPGLEYLFGAVTVEAGTSQFHDWWAHDAAEERQAFEQAVDWLHARWRSDPAMHIYHYASYEITALRTLMGRYATREAEVDDLLRHEVFVDLYAVTRTGVAIGTRGYSLKDIEVLFSPPRTSGVTDASSSIVEYQRWLDSGEPREWRRSPILTAIRDYNREDCESTWRLTDWLRARQAESGIGYLAPQREGEASEAGEAGRPADELAAALLAQAAVEPDPERQRVTTLLAWLLNYHRRAEKPMWWQHYQWLGSTAEELRDDAECLAGLALTDTPPVAVKRSRIVEYRFDPEQETRLKSGDRVYVLTDQAPLKREIDELDADAGLLTIKFGPSTPTPAACHLIPDEHVSSAAIQDAVQRLATRWLKGAASCPAAADLLFRRPPRLTGRGGGLLLSDTPRLPDDLVGLVQSLDGTTLCIQGPPGAGKTFNAAAVIVALVSGGAKVGVTSNSHKVILNLLAAVADEAARRKARVPILKVKGGDDSDDNDDDRLTLCASKEVVDLMDAAAGGLVVGGTAWAFVRPELEQRFDYLFVDEAGQVSLANAAGMSLATRNLVLIGDQMQLAQPAQGSHPGQSGLSCLHYLLAGHATVPPDRGVLLPTTFRLHPEICSFISATAYDGRLRPDAQTARRRIVLPADAKLLRRGTGIVMQPLEHDGNTWSSEEEGLRIAGLLDELTEAGVEIDGERRDFDVGGDVLIVAPYNAQVRQLREMLGELRIASVDKFQGQEAPVVIVSMCASTLDETPRGAGFLLSPNRLNVAISRAQCLAIVVASTRLIRARPSSVEEMALMNLFCRLNFHARDLEAVT